MTTSVKEENGIIEATYDSSNIASSKFEKETNTLYITFVKGDLVYKYKNINPSDYYYLQYAESTGKAFIEKIKNKYTGEKI
jgi:hypothetical protein